MGSFGLLTFILTGWLAADALPAGASSAVTDCSEVSGARSYRALSAHDGTSILTTDGYVVLAGLTAPGDLDGDPEATSRATQMLDRLVAGKNIFVNESLSRVDRYGRIVSQVVVLEDGKPRWVQGGMVASGEARVASGLDGSACTRALLRTEAEARVQGKGNWANPRFAIHGPYELEQLTASEGRFMLVEGVVRRTGEAGGRIYLDFGGRFNEDFSVIVPRDAHKAFTSAGIDLRSLEGARVRVRGIITLRGGPAIELRDPAAMEWLKADGA